MNLSHGGSHFDWPLSRDEKKYHIMQLYDKELQAVYARPQEIKLCSFLDTTETANSQVLHADYAEGPLKARRSDASTAETEFSTLAESLCDDQLDTISEEQGAAMQFSGLTDGIHAALNASEDELAKNAAKNLREAVADAVAVLQGFARYPSDMASLQTSHGAVDATHCSTTPRAVLGIKNGRAPCRRAFSEEIPQATRRTSLGRREGPQRHLPRGGRARPESRSATPIRERVDSDDGGGDGDVEDLYHKVEMRPVRRGRRSLVPEQCTVPAPLPESGGKNQLIRSKSVPPVRQLESIENFLGLSVPACPWS